MTDSIGIDVTEAVAVITLNRPDRHNAMDNAMSAAFGEAISAAQDDPAVRAILLRGEGKSFCTGRDTAALGVRAPGVSDFAHVSKSQQRSEERRVGKECVSTGRTRRSPDHNKKKQSP